MDSSYSLFCSTDGASWSTMAPISPQSHTLISSRYCYKQSTTLAYQPPSTPITPASVELLSSDILLVTPGQLSASAEEWHLVDASRPENLMSALCSCPFYSHLYGDLRPTQVHSERVHCLLALMDLMTPLTKFLLMVWFLAPLNAQSFTLQVLAPATLIICLREEPNCVASWHLYFS